MNKTRQFGLITLLLSVFTLCACSHSGPSADEIGLVLLGHVAEISSVKVALEDIKIVSTTAESDNANNISVEFVLEAKENLYKRISKFQFKGKGAPYCEFVQLELNKGDTVKGKAVVYASFLDKRWSYRIKDMTTDVALGGSDSIKDITNLVNATSEIENARGDVSFAVTAKNKDSVLKFIDEKQLIEKQKIAARDAEMLALETKIDALRKQYSLSKKEFEKAENIEHQKQIVVKKALESKSWGINQLARKACDDEFKKQDKTPSDNYEIQKTIYSACVKKAESELASQRQDNFKICAKAEAEALEPLTNKLKQDQDEINTFSKALYQLTLPPKTDPQSLDIFKSKIVSIN